MATTDPVAPPAPAAAGARPVALVVEDDDDVAALLASHLERLGWACHRVATGEEGVALAPSLGAQLALVDICLPGIDGREVVRQLRSRAETSGCVVVVTTVLEGDDLGDVAFDALLPKPFSRRDVERLLAGVLRQASRPHRDAPAAGAPGTGAPVPLPRPARDPLSPSATP